MKITRIPHEVEFNVVNYLDVLFNQDTDNDIITLRQLDPAQRIINTPHLDSNTSLFTPTYFYLHPKNNELFQGFHNYVSTVRMLDYIQGCFAPTLSMSLSSSLLSHKFFVIFLIQRVLMMQL